MKFLTLIFTWVVASQLHASPMILKEFTFELCPDCLFGRIDRADDLPSLPFCIAIHNDSLVVLDSAMEDVKFVAIEDGGVRVSQNVFRSNGASIIDCMDVSGYLYCLYYDGQVKRYLNGRTELVYSTEIVRPSGIRVMNGVACFELLDGGVVDLLSGGKFTGLDYSESRRNELIDLTGYPEYLTMGTCQVNLNRPLGDILLSAQHMISHKDSLLVYMSCMSDTLWLDVFCFRNGCKLP